MTPDASKRLVFLAGAGMATYVLIAARGGRKDPERTYKSLWAIGVVTLGLSIVADFAPQVAGPFALLVFLAMAVRNSGQLGTVLQAGAGSAGARRVPRAARGAGPPAERPEARER